MQKKPIGYYTFGSDSNPNLTIILAETKKKPKNIIVLGQIEIQLNNNVSRGKRSLNTGTVLAN